MTHRRQQMHVIRTPNQPDSITLWASTHEVRPVKNVTLDEINEAYEQEIGKELVKKEGFEQIGDNSRKELLL